MSAGNGSGTAQRTIDDDKPRGREQGAQLGGRRDLCGARHGGLVNGKVV